MRSSFTIFIAFEHIKDKDNVFSLTVFTRIIRLRQVIYLQSLSKLTDEQMDKVRRIVHQKLKPFHFQIKSYYLSGANYPTDNPSPV